MAMIWSHFSGGKFLDRRDELDAGIVDQYVHRTELALAASAIMAAHLGALAHVGAGIDRLDAEILFDAAAFLLDRLRRRRNR